MAPELATCTLAAFLLCSWPGSDPTEGETDGHIPAFPARNFRMLDRQGSRRCPCLFGKEQTECSMIPLIRVIIHKPWAQHPAKAFCQRGFEGTTCALLPPAGCRSNDLKYFRVDLRWRWTWTWPSSSAVSSQEWVRGGEQEAGVCPKFLFQMKGETWRLSWLCSRISIVKSIQVILRSQ